MMTSGTLEFCMDWKFSNMKKDDPSSVPLSFFVFLCAFYSLCSSSVKKFKFFVNTSEGREKLVL